MVLKTKARGDRKQLEYHIPIDKINDQGNAFLPKVGPGVGFSEGAAHETQPEGELHDNIMF